MNFKERYINNQVSIADLDSYVALWHDEKPDVSLQEFLGFTDEEYAAFAHSEAALVNQLKNNAEANFSHRAF